MTTTNESQIFLDGKSQMIEMLKIMSQEEKDKLLEKLKLRNPQLANELLTKSLSFRAIINLPKDELNSLAKYIDPAIFGMALKGESEQFQRHILSSIDRSYAEKAYSVMIQSVNKEEYISRAKDKILTALFGAALEKTV